MEVWTIVIICLTSVTVVLQVILLIILIRGKEDNTQMVKELWEFKSSIIEIINTKFSDILKENKENEKW